MLKLGVGCIVLTLFIEFVVSNVVADWKRTSRR